MSDGARQVDGRIARRVTRHADAPYQPIREQRA